MAQGLADGDHIALGYGEGKAHEAGEKFGEGIHRQITPAVRSGEENHPAHVVARAEVDDPEEALSGLRSEVELFRWRIHELLPEMLPAGADLQPGDKSAHAVSDQHHAVEVRVGPARIECGAEAVHLLTQLRRRGPDGQAGRVEEKPELIALADLFVGQQIVDGRHPGFGTRHEAVDKDHGDFVGIIGGELEEAGLVHGQIGADERTDIHAAVAAFGEHVSERSGEIGGELGTTSVDDRIVVLARAVENKRRLAAIGMQDGGDGFGNSGLRRDPGLPAQVRRGRHIAHHVGRARALLGGANAKPFDTQSGCRNEVVRAARVHGPVRTAGHAQDLAVPQGDRRELARLQRGNQGLGRRLIDLVLRAAGPCGVGQAYGLDEV